jgi:lipid A 4'-phosphatase
LVVNVLFKEHWGRARPLDVTEFGGDHLFTSALTITNQCAHNCSFVGGEASSFAALFFVLFFVLRADLHSPSAYLKLGVALGIAVFGSLLRVAFGHHFLSDIVFAWATMFAVVAAIAAAFDRLQWDYRWRVRL